MANVSFYHKVMGAQILMMVVVLVFQIIVCLGVPVTMDVYLSKYQNTRYGVFGICRRDACTTMLGYWNLKGDHSFELPSNARVSISYLLIVHPIATGFSVVQLLLFGYLMTKTLFTASWVLILVLLWSLPTFLLALLTFLVDLILFTPHLSWFGWMQLVCAALIATTGSLTCILRRTVTSRDELKLQDNFIYLDNWQDQYDEDEEESLFTAENSHFTDQASSYFTQSDLDTALVSLVHRNGSRDLLIESDLFENE